MPLAAAARTWRPSGAPAGGRGLRSPVGELGERRVDRVEGEPAGNGLVGGRHSRPSSCAKGDGERAVMADEPSCPGPARLIRFERLVRRFGPDEEMLEAVDWDHRWRLPTCSAGSSQSCATLSAALRRRFRRGDVDDAFFPVVSRWLRCGLQPRRPFGAGRASRRCWVGESERRMTVSTDEDEMEFDVESRRLRPVVDALLLMTEADMSSGRLGDSRSRFDRRTEISHRTGVTHYRS